LALPIRQLAFQWNTLLWLVGEVEDSAAVVLAA
jgi:hypothetical protein